MLSDKYNTEICIEGSILYRYYNGKSENRNGYGFPLSKDPADIRACVKLLKEDAKRRNIPLKFCLCDESQKEQIDRISKFNWNSTVDDNFYDMNVFGGILYVGDEPVAMTIASEISPKCVDVHYEKAIGEYARNGAFAMVNQCFASSQTVSKYEFINREEDMGIEGLRQAKETYDPLYKLQKFYGKVIS